MRRLALVLSVVTASSLAAQSAWPTKGWPTATPQAVGLKAAVLDSIDAEIGSGRYGYADLHVGRFCHASSAL